MVCRGDHGSCHDVNSVVQVSSSTLHSVDFLVYTGLYTFWKFSDISCVSNSSFQFGMFNPLEVLGTSRKLIASFAKIVWENFVESTKHTSSSDKSGLSNIFDNKYYFD